MGSEDPMKNLCWFIGTVIAGSLMVGGVLCVVAAITERNGWFLLALPIAALLAFGYYKAFTSE